MELPSNRLFVLVYLVITVSFFLPAHYAFAIGDGPRAYQTLPDDTDMVAFYGVYTEGNMAADPGTIIRDADIDVTLGVLQYTHTIDIKGQQGAFFGVVPFGKLDGSVKILGHKLSGSSSGIGDIQLGCIFGLQGSPSLPPARYKTYKPGFTYGVLGKLSLPTGEYDEDKILNLGANRWSVQLGLPMAYSIGKSMLDPSLTRFEFLPSITFYTDNDDPYHADKSEQAPVWNLEAHAIQNLNMMLWVSLDALYTYGGQTTTDSLKDDNTQRAFFLGGSVNITVSKSASVKLSYGKSVKHNDNSADGWMTRAIISLIF